MFSIIRFDKVDSTNSIARKCDFEKVIVASVQTKGKGRFNRNWDSQEGGLWFSIVLKPSRKMFEYTFIASLAVLRAIEVGEIKWPNDIIYRGKKVCGILTEVVTRGEDSKVIVGIGINVNNEIPDSLKDVAISLKDIKGKALNIDSLLNKIILNYEEISKKDFKNILIDYKRNCSILGKEIKVKTLTEEIDGKAVDIDDEGNLVVEVKGKMIRLNEGDVSIV